MILAITLHEAAHAWVAFKLGDNTAYSKGRVTLNPVSHIDPIGTIAVPLAMFILTGMAFGWAKPVPFKEGNLRNPKLHSGLVALAGPMTNLLMAFAWAGLAYFTKYPLFNSWVGDNIETVHMVARVGVIINVTFTAFNLIPILPLDGGRVLKSLLPRKLALEFEKTESWGQWLVLILGMTGIFGALLTPITTQIIQLLKF